MAKKIIKDLKYFIASYLVLEDLLIIFPTHKVTEIVRTYGISIPHLSYATKCGNLKLVQYLIEVGKVGVTENRLYEASTNGHFAIVKYLMSKFKISPVAINEILIDVSAKGYLNILKYVVEVTRKKPSTSAIVNACSSGHLEVVKYLFAVTKIAPTIKCMDLASQHGHLEVVQYLVEKANITPTRLSLECVIANQHLVILQYFIKKKISVTSDEIDTCIKHGANRILKYLIETLKIKPEESAINLARENRDLETIKYLIELGGFKPTEVTLSNAIIVEHENIPIIKYLIKIIDPAITEKLLSYISKVQNVDMHTWYNTHIKE